MEAELEVYVTGEQFAYLCPDRAAVLLSELRRSALEAGWDYRRHRIKAAEYCARSVPRGPRPVRRFTDVISGDETRGYSIGSGDGGVAFDRAQDDGLVAAVDGLVTVLTGTEGDVCLTIRSYRKAPPLALKGWDRVAEVGFVSKDGKPDIGPVLVADEPPPITVEGPGSYRVRVHVRGRGAAETVAPEMPAEHHLIVVFPGGSTKQRTFKNIEG
ncbi:hypothetical protein [Actinomadura sp. KC216]|uniref:hypothetical protein n=1 Tax=Actinomadura sp. KC216 TaxID=2530370 RepID=UPI00104D5AC8|nr:hypothetical protein [Actinomadura sp. KC216]